MPSGFEVKKQRILEQLTIASEQYNDRSPKGSIDEGIRGLVDEINDVPGLVTTSSCAGRVSVFLEGKKKIASDEHPFPSALTRENDSEPLAIGGPGGKGGGKWLFVSHTPLATSSDDVNSTPFQDLFGLKSREYFSSSISHGVRLVHFKFEAMVRSQSSVTHQLLPSVTQPCSDLTLVDGLLTRCPNCTLCCIICRVPRKWCNEFEPG